MDSEWLITSLLKPALYIGVGTMLVSLRSKVTGGGRAKPGLYA